MMNQMETAEFNITRLLMSLIQCFKSKLYLGPGYTAEQLYGLAQLSTMAAVKDLRT